MWPLYAIAAAAVLASLAADKRKTARGVLRGMKMLAGLIPVLLAVLAGVALVLAALPPRALAAALGGSGPWPFIVALGIGSIALMPGFIAYPLAATLRANGASDPVLAAFITTLMMVGVLTLPVEARFFGWRVALERNALALAGSVVVAVGMAAVLP